MNAKYGFVLVQCAISREVSIYLAAEFSRKRNYLAAPVALPLGQVRFYRKGL